MPTPPSEVRALHTRILKVTLEADNAQEYWRRPPAQRRGAGPRPPSDPRVEQAFNDYWFGARSMARIRDLLTNFDARFGAYPGALDALAAWPSMDRETRVVICHWHVQLSDPLYRAFTGDYCPPQREGGRALTRDAVLRWVIGQDKEQRWSATTHAQFASKLLSCAKGAGLVGRNQDPRPLTLPRVTTAALGYLLYLLRSVEFTGSLHDNPYLRSVGLVGGSVEDRVRAVPGVSMRRIADLVEFSFEHDTPLAWVRRHQETPS